MRGEGGRGIAGSQANDSMSTAVSCAHGAQINSHIYHGSMRPSRNIDEKTVGGGGGGGYQEKK
jgi:hypothetical protein